MSVGPELCSGLRHLRELPALGSLKAIRGAYASQEGRSQRKTLVVSFPAAGHILQQKHLTREGDCLSSRFKVQPISGEVKATEDL